VLPEEAYSKEEIPLVTTNMDTQHLTDVIDIMLDELSLVEELIAVLEESTSDIVIPLTSSASREYADNAVTANISIYRKAILDVNTKYGAMDLVEETEARLLNPEYGGRVDGIYLWSLDDTKRSLQYSIESAGEILADQTYSGSGNKNIPIGVFDLFYENVEASRAVRLNTLYGLNGYRDKLADCFARELLLESQEVQANLDSTLNKLYTMRKLLLTASVLYRGNWKAFASHVRSTLTNIMLDKMSSKLMEAYSNIVTAITEPLQEAIDNLTDLIKCSAWRSYVNYMSNGINLLDQEIYTRISDIYRASNYKNRCTQELLAGTPKMISMISKWLPVIDAAIAMIESIKQSGKISDKYLPNEIQEMLARRREISKLEQAARNKVIADQLEKHGLRLHNPDIIQDIRAQHEAILKSATGSKQSEETE